MATKTYIFMDRLSGDPNGKEVARVTFDGKTSVWSGDPDVKNMILEDKVDGEQFSDTNPDHMELLPILYSGSYFWVAEE